MSHKVLIANNIGAPKFSGGSLLVQNSTIVNNESNGPSGIIFNYGVNAIIKNSIIIQDYNLESDNPSLNVSSISI